MISVEALSRIVPTNLDSLVSSGLVSEGDARIAKRMRAECDGGGRETIRKSGGSEEITFRKSFAMGERGGVFIKTGNGRLERAGGGDQETAVRKVERGVRLGAVITRGIDELVQKAGMSPAEAATTVTTFPVIQEQVRKERQALTGSRDRVEDPQLTVWLDIRKGLERRSKPADELDATVRAVMTKHGMDYGKAYDHVLGTPEGKRLYNADKRARGIPVMNDDDTRGVGKADNTLYRGTARGRQNPDGDDNMIESADDVLQRLADAHQRDFPGASRAAAISAAAGSREFGQAHQAEKLRKFARA